MTLEITLILVFTFFYVGIAFNPAPRPWINLLPFRGLEERTGGVA